MKFNSSFNKIAKGTSDVPEEEDIPKPDANHSLEVWTDLTDLRPSPPQEPGRRARGPKEDIDKMDLKNIRAILDHIDRVGINDFPIRMVPEDLGYGI